MIRYFLIVIAAIGLTSCSENSSSTASETVESTVPESEMEKVEGIIEKRIADTELNENLQINNSLYYTKEDGSSLEVQAYVDSLGNVFKLEERFVDGKTQAYGKNVFYVWKGKKYASKEHFEEGPKGNVKFVERMSYYDANEKVVQTKIRKAVYEEDLEAVKSTIVPNFDCSVQRAMDVLNNEGEFELLFQGYVLQGTNTYLTVGGNGANDYISAIMLQFHDTFTRKMLNNQSSYMGKKLDVQFQKMIDETGFEYQIVLSVKPAK